MAMACAAATVAAMSSSAAFVSSSSRISPASSSSASATNSFGYRSVQVRCAQMEEKAKAKAVSRREVFSLATLSILLVASDKAEARDARDIPLFGLKKKVEQAEKAVEKEVKELEKEGSALLQAGEKELSKDVQGVEKAVSSAVSDIETVTPAGLSPTLQAGGVLGAELVAVLVASSVVNGLVSVP